MLEDGLAMESRYFLRRVVTLLPLAQLGVRFGKVYGRKGRLLHGDILSRHGLGGD